jgi:hypothetical protein
MRIAPVAAIVLIVAGFDAGRAQAPDSTTAARTKVRRVYTTRHLDGAAPRLDGKHDDACWSMVEWSSEFTQWEPSEGQPPTFQTAFKILYDDQALYVAYRAYDSEPNLISDLLSRRDRFPGDWVEINIDSSHDLRTAYSFTASVSGVRGDEFISDDGDNWNGNWDPIWDLATQQDAEGWTAEVRIPFSQLRFENRDDQVWGIQVQRRLFRKEERSLWQAFSKKDTGWVNRFGELHGIRGVRPQRQVELLPYSVGRGERFEKVPSDPFLDGADADFELGLDGKLGVSSDLTLDFTVNPDFGQVEADPSEVNLTAFETRFDEKRPFFIEGGNILDFQLAPSIAGGSFTADNLFYSRRIGRGPRHFPSIADGEYVDVPNQSSIIAASKLSGKLGRGISVGLLESVTAKENARIDRGGVLRDEAVEPITNFFVSRLQQDLRGGNTQLGALVGSVHRDLDAPQLGFLHRTAYSGGVDLLHQWRDKKWYVAGTAAASRVQGEARALLATQTASARYFQRPDNDYEDVDSTRTSLSGHAGSLRLGKRGGKHWRFESGAAWRSPGFEINDLGFMRRADEVNQFSWAQYSIRNPFSIFRGLWVNGNQWLDWDFGGARLNEQANLNFSANLKNYWNFGAGTTRLWERQSNTVLRGGPSALLPGVWSGWWWVDSDQRKKVFASFGGNWNRGDDHSARFDNVWVDMTYRPWNALQMTLSPSYSVNEQELQFVTTRSFGVEPRFLFGALEQETAALTLRLDYTVRPNLTVQYYGAPFISAGTYAALKRITNPRAGEFRDRFHTFTPGEISRVPGRYDVDENTDGTVDYSFNDPDFNVRDFNSNLVVRWEFQPGSLLYLVWSQARSDFIPDGRFALGNDSRALFDVHPHNIFLLKLSKWISL